MLVTSFHNFSSVLNVTGLLFRHSSLDFYSITEIVHSKMKFAILFVHVLISSAEHTMTNNNNPNPVFSSIVALDFFDL